MHLKLIFALLFSFFTIFIRAAEPDLTSFKNLEELISFETEKIVSTPETEKKLLADAFLNRAETFILMKNTEAAIDNMLCGLHYASYCRGSEKDILTCRGLFGLCIAYAIAEKEEEMKSVADELIFTLQNLQCADCHKDHEEELAATPILQAAMSNAQRTYIFKCSSSIDYPIYGPDRVTVNECIEFAEGLAKGAREVILFVPKQEWRTILSILIQGLENEAKHCCYAGGIWKACLQPLANKFHNWNEKYRVLGIPPDPYWD